MEQSIVSRLSARDRPPWGYVWIDLLHWWVSSSSCPEMHSRLHQLWNWLWQHLDAVRGSDQPSQLRSNVLICLIAHRPCRRRISGRHHGQNSLCESGTWQSWDGCLGAGWCSYVPHDWGAIVRTGTDLEFRLDGTTDVIVWYDSCGSNKGVFVINGLQDLRYW